MPILDAYRSHNWFKIERENKFNGKLNNDSPGNWPKSRSLLQQNSMEVKSMDSGALEPSLTPGSTWHGLGDFEQVTWMLWTSASSVKSDNWGVVLTRLLWRVNELIHVNHRWPCLAHSKCIHALVSVIGLRGGRIVLGLWAWILVVLDKRFSDSPICGYKHCCLSNNEDGNEGD